MPRYEAKRIRNHIVPGRLVRGVAFQTGTRSFTWDFCAAPMTDDVILGLDFLEGQNTIINLKHTALHIDGQALAAELVPGEQMKESRVLIRKGISVSPNSVMTLAATLEYTSAKL